MSEPRAPICDFCNATPVAWAYPTSDFTERDVGWGSHGGWAACQRCSTLIETGDREGLDRRSAKRLARVEGTTAKAIMPQIRKLHARFWASRTGEPMPITDPEDPIDPTRTDRYGSMLRAEGSAFDIVLERTPEAAARQPEGTFSEEVVREFADASGAWLMSRIIRKNARTGVMAKKARCEVRITLDDDDPDASAAFRFILPDSGHRREAA